MASRPTRRLLLAALASAAAAALALADAADSAISTRAADAPVLVFAAASLTDAVTEAAAAFTARTGIKVQTSFAASSVLAKQIEAGAPAEVFFSADRDWMDYLEQRTLLRAASRHDLLGNRLVLIAPAASTLQLRIAPGFKLAAALGAGKLATGYAQAALTKLGVWDSVSGRLVRAENVRAALEYVARGETPLGIVYQTDAQVEKRVRVVAVFPPDTHPPITYPLALTATARPAAEQFANFLAGDAARAIFVRYGFEPLTAAH
jgi:molybdate transport system substrate-binding protein